MRAFYYIIRVKIKKEANPQRRKGKNMTVDELLKEAIKSLKASNRQLDKVVIEETNGYGGSYTVVNCLISEYKYNGKHSKKRVATQFYNPYNKTLKIFI